MYCISPLHIPSHIASPASARRAAQPQVATPVLLYSTPPLMSPVALASHPYAPMPAWADVPDCPEEGSTHHSPRLPPHFLQATGYPYLPYNPTQDELEACTHRMRSVKLRHFPASRSESNSETSHSGASNGCRPNVDPHLLFPALSGKHHPYSTRSDEEASIAGWRVPDSPVSDQSQNEMKFPFHPFGISQPVPKAPASAPVFVGLSTTDNSLVSGACESTAEDNSNSVPCSDSSESRAIACKAIEEIIYKLNLSVLKFNMPSNLEFVASKDGETSHQLPFTPCNRPLIQHKHNLDVLLDKLDGIETQGDTEVRKLRKHAVDEVKRSIEELNHRQLMAWFVQQYELKRGQT